MRRTLLIGALPALLVLALPVAAPAQEGHGTAAPPEQHATQPAAGHAADAHGEQSNIFAGGLGNMIWTTLIFGAVVYVLGKKAWPKMIQALDDREQAIHTSLENARRDHEAAQKLLADYQAQLDKARQEATAIIEEGRRDGEAVQRRIQDEARQEADQMIARAKREVQLAADTAIKDLYDRTAELAVQIAGGIIQKSLSPDDHRKLVTESLERVQAANQAKLN